MHLFAVRVKKSARINLSFMIVFFVNSPAINGQEYNKYIK